MLTPDRDTLALSVDELCVRIETLTTQMMNFWKSSDGWAPIEATGLLTRSKLEWQASLSSSLRRWASASSDGDLILAWANLGALVEGQLTLFLSVNYNEYTSDEKPIRDRLTGSLIDPDRSELEGLRRFFVRRIWTLGRDWNPYVERIQRRRNAIHAFRARDIGMFADWGNELAFHLSFIRDINSQMPYPDSICEPREYYL
jgi:hypothetical protein